MHAHCISPRRCAVNFIQQNRARIINQMEGGEFFLLIGYFLEDVQVTLYSTPSLGAQGHRGRPAGKVEY